MINRINPTANVFIKRQLPKLLLFVITVIFASIVFPFKSICQTGFPGSITYTSKPGDSLYFISKAYNVSIDALKIANGLENDTILTSQTLNIPINTDADFGYYTVARGDSLYSIAIKQGVSINSIIKVNGILSNLIMPGQVLVIPYVQYRSLSDIIKTNSINTTLAPIDILVNKTDHTLLLFSNGTWLKTYHVDIGLGGIAPKRVSGDCKTPEGTFCICDKQVLYPPDPNLGTRWMQFSYPNKQDAERGLNTGIINIDTYNLIVDAINNGTAPPQKTALGGEVGIHGGTTLMQGRNWTWGCIGLANSDVEDFYDFINVGTRVVIQK